MKMLDRVRATRLWGRFFGPQRRKGAVRGRLYHDDGGDGVHRSKRPIGARISKIRVLRANGDVEEINVKETD